MANRLSIRTPHRQGSAAASRLCRIPLLAPAPQSRKPQLQSSSRACAASIQKPSIHLVSCVVHDRQENDCGQVAVKNGTCSGLACIEGGRLGFRLSRAANGNWGLGASFLPVAGVALAIATASSSSQSTATVFCAVFTDSTVHAHPAMLRIAAHW